MPNNTQNCLKIYYHGSIPGMIDKIISEISSEDYVIDFNKIIPLESDSIDEAREKWNTKWNSYEGKVTSKENWKAILKFETAWSYPQPILKKLFERYPEFEFTFITACEGGWFAGIITHKEGKTEERWWNDDPDVKEAILEALKID